MNRWYAPKTPRGSTTRRSTPFSSFASSPARFWNILHRTCTLSVGIKRPEREDTSGVKKGCLFYPHCSSRLQGTLKFDARVKLISEGRF